MPFPDEPCAACPRVARGLPSPCLAMDVRNPRYCMHAASGHKGYVALLSGDSLPPAPAYVATTIPVSESTRRLKLARACEHRTDPKCGCAGIATCLLGKGRAGQVSLSECLQCVVGQEPV